MQSTVLFFFVMREFGLSFALHLSYAGQAFVILLMLFLNIFLVLREFLCFISLSQQMYFFARNRWTFFLNQMSFFPCNRCIFSMQEVYFHLGGQCIILHMYSFAGNKYNYNRCISSSAAATIFVLQQMDFHLATKNGSIFSSQQTNWLPGDRCPFLAGRGEWAGGGGGRGGRGVREKGICVRFIDQWGYFSLLNWFIILGLPRSQGN